MTMIDKERVELLTLLDEAVGKTNKLQEELRQTQDVLGKRSQELVAVTRQNTKLREDIQHMLRGHRVSKEHARSRRVVLESPYSAPTDELREENVAYARKCMQDSLNRSEAPFLGHLLYTQVWDDRVPELRHNSIEAWISAAGVVAFYIDRGFSSGMLQGLLRAKQMGTKVEMRSIEGLRVEHWSWNDSELYYKFFDPRQGREIEHCVPFPKITASSLLPARWEV